MVKWFKYFYVKVLNNVGLCCCNVVCCCDNVVIKVELENIVYLV